MSKKTRIENLDRRWVHHLVDGAQAEAEREIDQVAKELGAPPPQGQSRDFLRWLASRMYTRGIEDTLQVVERKQRQEGRAPNPRRKR